MKCEIKKGERKRDSVRIDRDIKRGKGKERIIRKRIEVGKKEGGK
jgi:hypothetical protein